MPWERTGSQPPITNCSKPWCWRKTGAKQRADSRMSCSRVMMRSFFGERQHGEGEGGAETSGVVEGRCQESTGVCEKSVVWDSDGEEVASVARRRRAEGDEIGNSVSFHKKEVGLGRLPSASLINSHLDPRGALRPLHRRTNDSLFLGVRGFGIDDVAFARKFLARNALRCSGQRRFPNLIARGPAGVIRIDRRVRMHR
jgi:hypothetical protein